jgi:signal peptidase I
MERLQQTQQLTPDTTAPRPENSPRDPKNNESFISEIIRFSLIALLVVLPIRIFIAQPFIVSGASMEVTFSTGEYLIIDQVTYQFEEPERGDVIVFRYPRDPSKFFIKRVIGLPGDSISINGRSVTITNEAYPNGVKLDEPYVLDMSPQSPIEETLSEDEYFVMGDNRNASSDSRMWGVLQEDKIIGRAYLRLFPLSEFEFFPGDYDTDAEIMGSLIK